MAGNKGADTAAAAPALALGSPPSARCFPLCCLLLAPYSCLANRQTQLSRLPCCGTLGEPLLVGGPGSTARACCAVAVAQPKMCLPASSGAGGAPARSLRLRHTAEEPLALLRLNLGAVIEAAACSWRRGDQVGWRFAVQKKKKMPKMRNALGTQGKQGGTAARLGSMPQLHSLCPGPASPEASYGNPAANTWPKHGIAPGTW